MTDPVNTTPATILYQPVPLKNVQPMPALLPRQRTGARLAGMISLLALSVGFWMLCVPLTILAVVGLIAGVGLVLMVVALFTSVCILRSHDVAKPWPVTGAATGFAIVASWIVASWIVATGAVGWLSWWPAARLLRAADSAHTAEVITRNHD